jgi:hypothetical protein
VTREEAKAAPAMQGTRQVLFIESGWDGFVDWLYDRGLVIVPILFGEDDIPVYGIGLSDALYERVRHRE